MTDNNTIRCKKCGNELPPGSVFCDRCGAALSSHGDEKIAESSGRKAEGGRLTFAIAALPIIAFVAVILFILFRGFINIDTNTPDDEPDFSELLAEMETRVTAEQYEKLEFGMSYSDVTELLGAEGIEKYSRTYYWPGELFGSEGFEYYYNSPLVTLGFSESEKLIEIKEHYLLDAAKIQDNRVNQREARIIVNDSILASVKNGMTYEEVSEILGADGILSDSESNKKGTSLKTYEWEYRFEDEHEEYDYKTMDIVFYNGMARRDNYSEWGKESAED